MLISTRRAALLAAALAVAGLPTAAHAQVKPQGQNVFDARGADHVRNAYLADMDTVHVKIVALAKAIPADKYAWRPSAGVRSVSEVLMHVVGEWYFWGPRSMAGDAPAGFGDPKIKLPALEKEVTGKDAVLAELEKSWQHCATQLKATDAAALVGSYAPWNAPVDVAALLMSGDMHEHLGQLIAYARSVGVAPPWSK